MRRDVRPSRVSRADRPPGVALVAPRLIPETVVVLQDELTQLAVTHLSDCCPLARLEDANLGLGS